MNFLSCSHLSRTQPKGTTQSCAFPTFLFQPAFCFVFSCRFYKQLWYSIDFLLQGIVFSQLNFYCNSDLFWFGQGTWQRLTQLTDHVRWIIHEKFPRSFKVKQNFRCNTRLQKKKKNQTSIQATAEQRLAIKFWLTRSAGNSILPHFVLHAHGSHEPWHVQSIVSQNEIPVLMKLQLPPTEMPNSSHAFLHISPQPSWLSHPAAVLRCLLISLCLLSRGLRLFISSKDFYFSSVFSFLISEKCHIL